MLKGPCPGCQAEWLFIFYLLLRPRFVPLTLFPAPDPRASFHTSILIILTSPSVLSVTLVCSARGSNLAPCAWLVCSPSLSPMLGDRGYGKTGSQGQSGRTHWPHSSKATLDSQQQACSPLQGSKGWALGALSTVICFHQMEVEVKCICGVPSSRPSRAAYAALRAAYAALRACPALWTARREGPPGTG